MRFTLEMFFKRCVDLPHLRASYRALARPRHSSRCTPLLGFVRLNPSRRHTVDRPLPGSVLERTLPFGTSLPRDVSWSALVVSHHLDGLLRSPGPRFHGVPHEGSLRFACTSGLQKKASSACLLALVVSVARPPRDPEVAPRSAARTLRRTYPICSRNRVTATLCPLAVLSS
jgi:hypothetical protein